jgi:hypothetical protein
MTILIIYIIGAFVSLIGLLTTVFVMEDKFDPDMIAPFFWITALWPLCWAASIIAGAVWCIAKACAWIAKKIAAKIKTIEWKIKVE